MNLILILEIQIQTQQRLFLSTFGLRICSTRADQQWFWVTISPSKIYIKKKIQKITWSRLNSCVIVAVFFTFFLKKESASEHCFSCSSESLGGDGGATVAKLQGSNAPRRTAFEAAAARAGVGVEGDGVDIADLRLEIRRPAEFPVVEEVTGDEAVARKRPECVFRFCLGKSENCAEGGGGSCVQWSQWTRVGNGQLNSRTQSTLRHVRPTAKKCHWYFQSESILIISSFDYISRSYLILSISDYISRSYLILPISV